MNLLTKSWLRNTGDERAVQNGCRFDAITAAWTVYWIERHCKLYEGEGYAGMPVVLHGCQKCDHADFYATTEPWWLDDDCTEPGPAQEIHLERARLFAECVANGHSIDWQYESFMRLFGWVKHSEKWGRDVRRFKQASFWCAKKNKKALDLATPVPTPAGWTTIGEIQVGDSVFGDDGKPCKVTHVHPVVIDEETYLVTFSNGEKVRCNGDHLWKTTVLQNSVAGHRERVFAGNQHTKSLGLAIAKTSVRTTRDIFASQLRGDGARNHSLEMPQPLELPDAQLPIDPYVLGAWLGDGDSDGARMTCSTRDYDHWRQSFEECGVELRAAASKPGSNGCRAAIGAKWGDFRTTLRAINVLNNKHIPSIYLRASCTQRLALLQGLLDTDGCIDKTGRSITFVTTKEELREGVHELLASLGIKFSLTERRTKIAGVDKGPCWWFLFNVMRDEMPVFRMDRKLSRMRSHSSLQMKPRCRTVQVVSVERVDPVPVRCITVSNADGMFLFGRTMLPTHNSPTLAALGMYLLAGDGEPGQKVYLAAKDKEQAKTNAAKHTIEMRLQSDELMEQIELNKTTCTLTHTSSRSVMYPLSSANINTQNSKEGLNGSVLIDETHVVDRGFVNIISRAGISRSEALFCEFSTAGDNPDSYGKERFDYCVDVLNDKRQNEQLLAIVHAVPQDLTEEQLEGDFERYARMANPAYGHTIDPAEIRSDYETSKVSMENLATFMKYRLNKWQHTTNPWLKGSDWMKCAGEFGEDDLLGQSCVAGIDLGFVWDMSAVTLLFANGEKGDQPCYRLLPKMFIPEAATRDMPDVAWKTWESEGWVTITDGDTTDFPLIRQYVNEASRLFDLKQIGYDPRGATQFAQQLMNEDGLPVIEVSQSPRMFWEPLQQFEAEVIGGRIQHPSNGCLNWQAGHATIGRNGMLHKPDGPKGKKKIDAIVASVIARALGALLDGHSGKSYYDKNPLEMA